MEFNPYDAIIVLVTLLLGSLITSFILWRKLKQSNDIKELVAWCVYEDDGIRYNIPLWAHIKDAQLHCNVPEKYRISWDEEKDYVNTILLAFQKSLSQKFFDGSVYYKRVNELTLRTNTSKYTDFFLFQLFCFLSDHHFDSKAFGRTVQKLYYITFLACKASQIYKDDIAGWLTPEYFTKDLDSNQIHISRL